ncbi:hypothetical protein Tco_0313810, partial [Tanacetum coccineum]
DLTRLLVELNEAWKVKAKRDPTVLPKGKTQAKTVAIRKAPAIDACIRFMHIDKDSSVNPWLGYPDLTHTMLIHTSSINLRADEIPEKHPGDQVNPQADEDKHNPNRPCIRGASPPSSSTSPPAPPVTNNHDDPTTVPFEDHHSAVASGSSVPSIHKFRAERSTEILRRELETDLMNKKYM